MIGKLSLSITFFRKLKDIVVELNKRNLLNRIGLKMSLEDFLGVPVDVVAYREDLSPLLKERIARDVIYV